jgi:archaellum component FlaF (FlaF/FlaG flagellin family)
VNLSYSKLIFLIILTCVLHTALFDIPSTVPDAEARRQHGVSAGANQQIKQTTYCYSYNGDTNCLNITTAILCQHAICIIGNISPFLISAPH